VSPLPRLGDSSGVVPGACALGSLRYRRFAAEMADASEFLPDSIGDVKKKANH
jgi:hypothetical protein